MTNKNKRRSILALITIAATGFLALALASLYDIGRADAQGVPPPDAAGVPYRELYVDAGVGTTPHVIPPPPADPQAQPAPVVNAQPTLLQQLEELRAAYSALKDNRDKSARMLLWAAAIATALKFALDLLGRLAGGKSWMPLVALGMAIPIGLLSHYAAGHSWFDSILVAGSGPAAVFVHELIKRFKPAPQPQGSA